MNTGRQPCRIRIEPWLKDHFVGEKIVLPAVETMLFLAEQCAASAPAADVRVMEDVRFGKFLEIDPAAADIPAIVEESSGTDGRVRLKVLSLIQFKAMARIKEHGDIHFPAEKVSLDSREVDPARPRHPLAEIDTKYLYSHLVPFGPHFHTLQDTLYLTERGAWGKVKAPKLPYTYPVQKTLGSPFPLDGAMHAACVLGQRRVDFVPFPVGFTRRTIRRPTRPGHTYLTRVSLTAEARDELVFDLDIFNYHGQLYETVKGLRMRDVGAPVKKEGSQPWNRWSENYLHSSAPPATSPTSIRPGSGETIP